MKERTAQEIIRDLEKRYKDDADAISVINRAKTDIAYIEGKERLPGYTGQPSIGKALELESFLAEWY